MQTKLKLGKLYKVGKRFLAARADYARYVDSILEEGLDPLVQGFYPKPVPKSGPAKSFSDLYGFVEEGDVIMIVKIEPPKTRKTLGKRMLFLYGEQLYTYQSINESDEFHKHLEELTENNI